MQQPGLVLAGPDEDVDDGIPLAFIKGGFNDGDIVYMTKDSQKSSNISSLTGHQRTELNKIIDGVAKKFSGTRSKKQIEENAARLRKSLFSKGKITDPLLADMKKLIKKRFDNQSVTSITVNDGVVQFIPRVDSRECAYTAGPSESGKSTWTCNYAKQYNKLFPKNKIFLFSKVLDDPSLRGIKNLVPISLDEDLLDEPILIEDLENSMTIFDDIDTLRHKEVRDMVNALRDDILETGRHHDIWCCSTSHQISDRNKTRTLLNEANLLTVFPQSGSAHAIKYTLQTYFGFDNADIRKLMKLPSRWVTVRKSFPTLVIYEHGVYLLSSE